NLDRGWVDSLREIDDPEHRTRPKLAHVNNAPPVLVRVHSLRLDQQVFFGYSDREITGLEASHGDLNDKLVVFLKDFDGRSPDQCVLRIQPIVEVASN